MKRAVQLPRDVRGDAMCRHTRPGGCTWWCSYRRAVMCIGPVAILFVVVGVLMWWGGDPSTQRRLSETVMGTLLFLAAAVPALLIANRFDPER